MTDSTWSPRVRMDIVEEHFDELDFLWEHREANLFTPDWTLFDLAYHEERMEAHLDGLLLAGDAGREFVRERLAGDEPSAIAVAATVLLKSGDAVDAEQVLTLFESAAGEPVVDGIRQALRHVPPGPWVDRLRSIAAADDELAAVAACDVLAFHREASFAATRFLGLESARARTLALGALGRTGQLSREDLSTVLDDTEPEVRWAALQEAARSQVVGLTAACRARALRATDPDPVCLRFLGVLSDPADVPELQAALTRPELARDAVAAIGASGRLAQIPTLLHLMADPDLGPDAVLAYYRITGADDVEGHLPVPRAADTDDEREALPPDPERARADWEKRAATMADTDAIWQGGFASARERVPEEHSAMTLEARRDAYLRARALDKNAPDWELEART